MTSTSNCKSNRKSWKKSLKALFYLKRNSSSDSGKTSERSWDSNLQITKLNRLRSLWMLGNKAPRKSLYCLGMQGRQLLTFWRKLFWSKNLGNPTWFKKKNLKSLSINFYNNNFSTQRALTLNRQEGCSIPTTAATLKSTKFSSNSGYF